MPRWLKLTLVWIVALALPLQGLAGSGGMRCAGSHHAAAPSIAAPAQADPISETAHAAHHEHAASPEQHVASDASVSSPSAHSCSLCAACCPAFALLNLPLTVVVPEAAHTGGADLRAGIARSVADAPERPPRA